MLLLSLNAKKGNYQFTINFFDDCDCIPGILQLKNIIHIPTGQVVLGYCDLFCQNTLEHLTASYLALLGSESPEEFWNTNYGKYYCITEYLTAEIHRVGDIVCPNEHRLDFYFKVSTEMGQILLIPYKNKLHLSPTTYTSKLYGQQDKEEPISSLYDFIHHGKNSQFKLEFSGEADLPALKNLISLYFDYTTGKYGFYDGENYRNRCDIENNLKGCEFKHSEDLRIGKEIDTVVTIEPELAFKSMSSHYPDGHYPHQHTTVHFTYYRGDTNVKATIKGQYIYVDEIVKEYYISQLKEYKPKIYDIGPEIKLRGTLKSILDQVSKLL